MEDGFGEAVFQGAADAAGIDEGAGDGRGHAGRGDAVARHPRLVVDDRDLPLGEAVEERGLPDIRAADDGNGRHARGLGQQTAGGKGFTAKDFGRDFRSRAATVGQIRMSTEPLREHPPARMGFRIAAGVIAGFMLLVGLPGFVWLAYQGAVTFWGLACLLLLGGLNAASVALRGR